MESGFTEFRLVCSAAIGKSESTIGHLESVSGAKIRVLDEHPSEECIIQLTVDSAASANRDNNHNVRKEEEETWTAEQKVLVRVYEAIMKVETGEQEEEEREVTCKMVIGRGICKVLEKIETESGANIRVLAKDHIHASSADELIQVNPSSSF